jgi:hypothetical protein
LLVGFAVIVGAFVLYGMHQASTVWLRSLIQNLPGGSSFLRAFNRSPVVSLIEKGTSWLFHRVRKDVGDALVARLAPLAHWLSALGSREELLLDAVAGVADDTAHALSWLRRHTVPLLIRVAVAPVHALAQEASRTAHRAIGLAHKAERDFAIGIDRLDHRLTAHFTRVFHGIDEFIHAHVLPRVRAVERAIAVTIPRRLWRIEHRLGRIEKALGLGLLSALVFRVLARVAPWIFCRNVKKLGNRVCGLRPGFLNFLLGAGAAMFAFAELCRLIELVATVAARVLPKLIAPLAVAGAALCDGRHAAAPPLSLQTTTLPRVANPLPL